MNSLYIYTKVPFVPETEIHILIVRFETLSGFALSLVLSSRFECPLNHSREHARPLLDAIKHY